MSLLFSITMIANTLKIPRPDNNNIVETVMAEEKRNPGKHQAGLSLSPAG